MKKTICIIYDVEFNENDINGACGGSETWAIQISKEFVRQGYNVIMVRPGDWVLTDNGVEYVPSHLLEYKINSQYFEAVIFSRNIDIDRYKMIVESKCTKQIYIQAHEIYIWKDGIYNLKYDYNYMCKHYPDITKYIALSDFHKQALNYYCNIPLDKIEIIGNAADTDIYYKIDKELGDVNKIEKSILWTSCFGRGADILIDDILPMVKQYIPDFKVKICGYVDVMPDEYKNRNDVKIVGFNLTKEEYYKELRKTPCWFYPCVTAETFNIAALDAVLNNCDIVSPMLHGMEYSMKPFKPLGMEHKFGTGETLNKNYDWGTYHTDKNSVEYNKACQEAARMIIESYGNYHEPIRNKVRKSFKNYILQEHSWQNVVKKWTQMFKKYENED